MVRAREFLALLLYVIFSYLLKVIDTKIIFSLLVGNLIGSPLKALFKLKTQFSYCATVLL
jgi:hypothetical protein